MAIFESDWFWWGLALALFALEALLPGIFMLWLGFAALGTGLLHVLLPGLGIAAQWMVFAVLSVVAVGIAWKFRLGRPRFASDHPKLNRRGEQLIDRVFALDQAIVDGRGRIKAGDAYWKVEGQDLPAGARVRVVGIIDGILQVTAVD